MIRQAMGQFKQANKTSNQLANKSRIAAMEDS